MVQTDPAQLPPLTMKKESPEWPGLKAYLLGKVEEERKKLEQIGLPPHLADTHRGAIAAFRSIIHDVDGTQAASAYRGGRGTNYNAK